MGAAFRCVSEFGGDTRAAPAASCGTRLDVENLAVGWTACGWHPERAGGARIRAGQRKSGIEGKKTWCSLATNLPDCLRAERMASESRLVNTMHRRPAQKLLDTRMSLLCADQNAIARYGLATGAVFCFGWRWHQGLGRRQSSQSIPRLHKNKRGAHPGVKSRQYKLSRRGLSLTFLTHSFPSHPPLSHPLPHIRNARLIAYCPASSSLQVLLHQSRRQDCLCLVPGASRPSRK